MADVLIKWLANAKQRAEVVQRHLKSAKAQAELADDLGMFARLVGPDCESQALKDIVPPPPAWYTSVITACVMELNASENKTKDQLRVEADHVHSLFQGFVHMLAVYVDTYCFASPALRRRMCM